MPLLGGERLEQKPAGRSCSADGCSARLSRYNPSDACGVHAGWRDAPEPRRRRRSAA